MTGAKKCIQGFGISLGGYRLPWHYASFFSLLWLFGHSRLCEMYLNMISLPGGKDTSSLKAQPLFFICSPASSTAFCLKVGLRESYFLEKYFYKTEWYSDYQLRLCLTFGKFLFQYQGFRGNLLLFFILIFFRASLLQSCFIAENAVIKRSFTISTIKIRQTESQLIYPVSNNVVSTTIAKVHCINNRFSSKGVRIN